MSEKLTPSELARLEAAGIKYPWHPRQSLRLLDEIEKLGRRITQLEGREHYTVEAS